MLFTAQTAPRASVYLVADGPARRLDFVISVDSDSGLVTQCIPEDHSLKLKPGGLDLETEVWLARIVIVVYGGNEPWMGPEIIILFK